MLENIRKALKEDLWNIIDEKEVKDREINDFLIFMFHMFLEKQNFSMGEVYKASNCIKNKYIEVLEESRNMAILGEPIKALKNIDKQFIEKIEPIMRKLLE